MNHLVLVVDDEPDIREVMKEALEDAGFTVALAANGAEALSALADGLKPSLILLDLMMPVMDGYEFRVRQWAEPTLASLPILIVSAAGSCQADARRLRARGYLSKPMELSALVRVVSNACAGKACGSNAEAGSAPASEPRPGLDGASQPAARHSDGPASERR